MLPRIIAAGQTLLEELSKGLVDITTEPFDGNMPVHIERRTKKTRLPGDWQAGCPALKVAFELRLKAKDRFASVASAKKPLDARSMH